MPIKEVTQRQVDHSKLSLSRVLIKMKRKVDLLEEEHESEHEESESSGDESEDAEPRIKEEPRIKYVLSHLSRAVLEKLLLNCCIVWPRPKIFFSGFLADNYFEINALFRHKHR